MERLNRDDMLLHRALENVARYFCERPDIDVVYGNRDSLDEVDKDIRVCMKLSAEKFSEENPLPMDDNEITWDFLQLIFDYLVPAGDENPDAVQLDLGNDTTLVRRDWKSARTHINGTVKAVEIPGCIWW